MAVHVSPSPEHPRPPHPIPQGCLSALALSAVSYIELGLVIFHIWQYTCFNVILSNHPTLTFSHRVQKSVLYLCVCFAVSHIGSLLSSF